MPRLVDELIRQDRCPCCGDTDLEHTHELGARFLMEQVKKLRNLEERLVATNDTEKN